MRYQNKNMQLRGPIISITLKITDEGSSLTITSPLLIESDPLLIESDFHKGKLDEQRKLLREDLDEFKNFIGSNELNVSCWTNVSKAIKQLHRRGRILSLQLFGSELTKVQNLLLPLIQSNSTYFPIVEVTASLDHIIPIEFLPLLNLLEPTDISNFEELESVAKSFLGFSTIIKRIIPRIPLATDTVLKNIPKLPVKFFHDAGLLGAQGEAKFFRELDQYIALEGPWPDRSFDNEDFINSVAEHIWNPLLQFNSATNRFLPDQIQHFACHCDTKANLSENYSLILAHHEATKRRVTIGSLQARLAHLSQAAQRSSDISLPLIFFNACGSSIILPTGVTSFPGLFLKNGNRGFIGTETNIPDKFSAAFSEQFYRNLLGGFSLGNAMLSAKWTLLRRYLNPLGILYVAYADPDIRLETFNSNER